jgi:hypothetical protein
MEIIFMSQQHSLINYTWGVLVACQEAGEAEASHNIPPLSWYGMWP